HPALPSFPTRRSSDLNYSTTRLDNLKYVVETCTGLTFRQAFRNTLEQMGMMDSVPGPDAALPELSNADVATPSTASRYRNVLNRSEEHTSELQSLAYL